MLNFWKDSSSVRGFGDGRVPAPGNTEGLGFGFGVSGLGLRCFQTGFDVGCP